MDNIVKAESFHRANIEDSLWYVMTEDDLNNIPRPTFGTKAYILTTKTKKIYGAYETNGSFWYDMPISIS